MKLDGIIQECVLLTPPELAGAASRPVPLDADGWVIFEPREPDEVLSFVWKSPAPSDFSPFDMISISMDVRAPKWGLTTWIRTDAGARRTALGEAAYYRCPTPGLRSVQGRFRWDQPSENFGVSGAPGAWKDIREVQIDTAAPEGGRISFGPVCLVRRRRVAGPRIADEEFLGGELDLERPGLERVRSAVEAGAS